LAGSAASRTGSGAARGAAEPAPPTRCPVRRHHLGSSAHCERPCCLSVPTPGARRRELGLRPTALVAYGAACRRASCRRNFRQEARLGQLKSAEQLPARRFPRATGCRWNRRPPTPDQKTVLTAIILRFLQQSVSEEGDGLRLRTLLSFSNFELNLLALFERAVAVHLDCAPVNEHVLVFAFEGDESVALFSVEPLDGTLCHYFSIQCSAIEIPHLSRDQTTASGMRKLVKLNRPRDFSH